MDEIEFKQLLDRMRDNRQTMIAIYSMLSDEQAKIISEQLVSMQHPKAEVHVHLYRISDLALDNILIALKNTKLINKLRITIEEKFIKAFAEILPHLQEVQELQINELDDQGIQLICEGLKSNTCIKKLSFASNKICYLGAAYIGQLLSINQNIVELDLSHNLLGLYDPSQVELIRNRKQFNFRQDGCGGVVLFSQGLKFFAQGFAQNRSLKVLRLTGCYLSSYDFKYLSKALESNRSLTLLDLSFNRITRDQLDIVATKIANHPSLTHLDLLGNHIGDEGAKHLANLITGSNRLKSLHLGINAIGFLGASHLSQMLIQNTSLEDLSLYDNPLTEQGVAILMEALTINRSLKWVNLDKTNLTEVVVNAISSMLISNHTLKRLYINYSPIEASTMKILAHGLRNNKGLISLSLYGCDIDNDSLNYLSEALITNTTLRKLTISVDYGKNKIINEIGLSYLVHALSINKTLIDLLFSYTHHLNNIEVDLLKQIKTLVHANNHLSNIEQSIFSFFLQANKKSPNLTLYESTMYPVYPS